MNYSTNDNTMVLQRQQQQFDKKQEEIENKWIDNNDDHMLYMLDDMDNMDLDDDDLAVVEKVISTDGIPEFYRGDDDQYNEEEDDYNAVNDSSHYTSLSSSSCFFLCGGNSNTNNKIRERFLQPFPKFGGIGAAVDVPTTIDDAEKRLQERLHKLTEDQQRRVFQDLQGGGGIGIGGGLSSDITKDGDEFLNECLLEMEYELNQLSRNTSYEEIMMKKMRKNEKKKHDDYDSSSSSSSEDDDTRSTNNTARSSSSNCNYLKDRKLRIAFLRSVHYQPRLAAYRMIRWCEEKCSIFGLESLTRDITLQDLQPEDHYILSSGVMYVCPNKDRYGRTIQCIFPHLRPFESPTDAMVSSVQSKKVKKGEWKGCVCVRVCVTIYKVCFSPVAALPKHRHHLYVTTPS